MIQSLADALFMPWVVAACCSGPGSSSRCAPVRAGPAVRRGRGGPRSRRRADGGARRADAVSGVHDGAGGVDRHRQHRRRGDGDRLGRSRRAVLDLGATGSSPWRSSSPRPSLGLTFREIRGGDGAVGPDVLPARRPALARRSPGSTRSSPAVAALTTTPFTQPNSIALVVNSVFGVPKVVTGIVVAVLTWLVIIGGIKSIGRAAEKLVAAEGGLYLAGGLIVIWSIARAFRACSATDRPPGVLDAGGRRRRVRHARGDALRHRARASTRTKPATARRPSPTARRRARSPSQQGLNAVIEVFTVSFVTSTISAMTILLTGAWQSGLTSSAAVAAGFNTVDADIRRLGRRLLCVPVRLHDADRVGVLRRAVLRVHPRAQRDASRIAGSTAC